MNNFTKIKSSEVKEGMRFSAPVFFDDGKNMFLAEGKAAKTYHITALKRWSIPYLLTYGHLLSEPEKGSGGEGLPVDELELADDLEPLSDDGDSENDVPLQFLGGKINIA
jgi:hypothetical protein